MTNAILRENSQPGSPRAEWDIVPPERFEGDTSGMDTGNARIQGFATDISANRGERIRFKIKTEPPAERYRLDIYRMGYYGGAGARRVATVQPTASLPQRQPDDLFDDATGLIDCGNWHESAHWDIPGDATSGIYLAKLIRDDSMPAVNHIIFVVRDDAGQSEILFQTADTTWQAYNLYGDICLYRRPGHPIRRAYKVSYNRPFRTRVDNVRGIDFIKDWVLNAEYPMVRFLERNGYDVSYCTGVDTDRAGERLRDHKVFLSVGHDEYWSGQQRANVEAARDAGVHLAFLSGNDVYWKTRWEPSIDGSATPRRTLVCYKETRDSAKLDPLPDVWTGTWRDDRFSPPADGGYPENALIGTIFMVNNDYNLRAITVPSTFARQRLWRNTAVAELADGATVTLGAGTLGWEWNTDDDNGFRPAGLVRLSATTVDGVPVSHDAGTPAGFYPDRATHHTTLYRRPNGALVFSAGTINWAWGLDAEHELQRREADGTLRYPANHAMQQITVNLLAEMGALAQTLQPDLRLAAQSAAPVRLPRSTIDSLPTVVTVGETLELRGTARATDGVIGAIELSVDDGQTWHPADGREQWRYQWTPRAPGMATVRCRAVDDLGYVEHDGPTARVHVVTIHERAHNGTPAGVLTEQERL